MKTEKIRLYAKEDSSRISPAYISLRKDGEGEGEMLFIRLEDNFEVFMS